MTFDLTTESGHRAWTIFRVGRGWLDSITAIGIFQNKTFHTMPIPNSGIVVKNIWADLIRKRKKIKGERIWFVFDDYRIALTVYNGSSRVTRIDIKKEENRCLP